MNNHNADLFFFFSLACANADLGVNSVMICEQVLSCVSFTAFVESASSCASADY